MLHLETLEPGTFSILKELMRVPELSSHSLVGGTALALRYGHRKSIDIDLFTEGDQDSQLVISGLTNAFGNAFTYRRAQQAKWAVFGSVAEVKLDVIRFPHARIAELEVVKGIRMYRDEDIGPMKVEAILHRARKKDFWDMAVLLEAHGVAWLEEHHRKKYPNNSILMSVPEAITYFKDAENDADPMDITGRTWEEVKQVIGRAVNGHVR